MSFYLFFKINLILILFFLFRFGITNFLGYLFYSRDYAKKYYYENKKHYSEYYKSYYQKNKDKILEKQKKYNKQNRKKINEYMKKYYHKKKGTSTVN